MNRPFRRYQRCLILLGKPEVEAVIVDSYYHEKKQDWRLLLNVGIGQGRGFRERYFKTVKLIEQ